MIIDFHTHCFSNNIAKSAISQLESVGDVKAFHDGTAAGLISYMRRYGIDKSVVLPVATKPSQVSVINEWAKLEETDKLCFFGSLHPMDENIYDVINQLKADGFKGVKMHPDYQSFLVDDRCMMPVYEALRDTGLTLVVHAGVDIGFPSLVHCTPVMISKVLREVPGLRLVVAHMGGHGLWRDVEDILLGKDIYIDTSFSSYVLGSEGMLRMIRKHGAEKVLFGSDSPWTDAGKELKLLNNLHLSSSQKDLIMYKNALELLD